MANGQLTIDFRGICTHFVGIVPAIPHRVVLPRVTQVRFGMLDEPGRSSSLPYVTLPHIAVVRSRNDLETLTFNVPGAMIAGVISDGVRIEVANAIGDSVQWDASFDTKVAQLTSFVPGYQFADEVVLGGRASCYLDLTSATIGVSTVNGEVQGVCAVIPTSGPPILKVSPFFQGTQNSPAFYSLNMADEDAHLIVANIGLECSTRSGIDFLLHYDTGKGGIPRALTAPLPNNGIVALHSQLGAAAEMMQNLKSNPFDVLKALDYETIRLGPSLACADSRFP